MSNVKNNKRKSHKKRRSGILAAAIVLALLICAGGTFAWMQSKDEVTNQLSSSNNFKVTVYEDFTPVEDWMPGQIINKDVCAVNTGNIDAFVRMGLNNTMKLRKKSTSSYNIIDNDPTTVSNEPLVTLNDDEVISIQAGGKCVVSPQKNQIVQ